MKERYAVSDSNVIKLAQPGAFTDTLTDILRRGARALLTQAVEAEVAEFLAKHADLKTGTGQQRVTSPAIPDNGTLAIKNACSDKQRSPNCVGENISPPLAWSGVPDGTKSLALLLFDPEGRAPAGVSHMVVYGIPADVKGFAEGELS